METLAYEPELLPGPIKAQHRITIALFISLPLNHPLLTLDPGFRIDYLM